MREERDQKKTMFAGSLQNNGFEATERAKMPLFQACCFGEGRQILEQVGLGPDLSSDTD